MERLYKKLAFSLWMIACSCFVATPATSAQEYCSLKVRVVTPKGDRPVVPVRVIEKNGKVTQQVQEARSDDLLFCDLGILPVTVVVGPQGCNQTTVTDIPLLWQKSHTLVVIYDYDACAQDPPPPPIPQCEILLRVVGPDGRRVDKASIKVDDPAVPGRETDSAGRAHFFVRLNGHLQGSVSAPGYRRKDFVLGCSDPTKHEQAVNLDKE